MFLLVAACTDPDEQSGPFDTASDVPVLQASPLEPTLGVDELEDAVAAVMYGSFLLPIDVYVWADALIRGSLGEDATCPTLDESVDAPGSWTSFWGGNCVGPSYSVSGDWQYTVERIDEAGIMEVNAVELHSIVGETVPDGELVTAGGALVLNWYAEGPNAEFLMYYSGSYLEVGRADPLGNGLGGALSIAGTYSIDGGFVGRMDGVSYGVLASIAFTDVSFAAGCASPSGVVQVRDPSTAWWDITLSDDCTGCGPATFAGAEHGEVCIGTEVQERVESMIAPYMQGVP